MAMLPRASFYLLLRGAMLCAMPNDTFLYPLINHRFTINLINLCRFLLTQNEDKSDFTISVLLGEYIYFYRTYALTGIARYEV